MTKEQQREKNKYFKMKRNGNVGEVWIYGDIMPLKWDDTDVTATDFKNELDDLEDVKELSVYINSGGGSVFEGIAIYNMLKRHKAKVNIYVDALAASIASVIAMAGDTIFMPKNSLMMIHNAWMMAVGNAEELRKTADDLDRINESSNQAYLERELTISEEELQQLLDAETWLSADECVQYGLADEVISSNQAVAKVSDDVMKAFKKAPETVKNMVETPEKATISEEERQEIQDYLQTVDTKLQNINL